MHKALLLSIVAHAALLVGARPLAARIAERVETVNVSAEPDRWVGNSVEVATSLEQPSPGGAAAPPADAAPSPPPPAPAPPADAASAPPSPAPSASSAAST